MSDPFRSSLPPQLEKKLQAFRRTWFRLQSGVLLGLFCLLPAVSFGLFCLSERIWATPSILRWLLVLPIPPLLAWLLLRWWAQWVWRKPDARKIAWMMGRLDARVGDQLLGAVELAEDRDDGSSAVLREAALQQVARGVAPINVEDQLDRSSLRRIVLGIACITGLVLLAAFFAPAAIRNSLERWVNPSSELERFTFVRLEGFRSPLRVPHGEPFAFSGSLRHHDDGNLPEVHLSRADRGFAIQVSNSLVEVRSEGVTEPHRLTLRAGDARKTIRLEPVFRPELTSLRSIVRYPAYLGMPPATQLVQRASLEVLRGASFTLQGEASRGLQRVSLNEKPSEHHEGVGFLFEDLRIHTNAQLRLNWVDEYGFGPEDPFDLQVSLLEDAAPLVELGGIAPAIALMPHEFVELTIHAEDDFGLKDLWLDLRMIREGSETERREFFAAEGGAFRTNLLFSPLRFGIEAGTDLRVQACGTDDLPGREASCSASYRIVVMSPEDHAKLVRQQMDTVLSEIDELLRDETMAIEENRMLQERADTALMEDGSSEDVNQQGDAEEGRREQLEAIEEQLKAILREAKRNETLEDSTIRKWAEISAALDQEAMPAMQTAVEEFNAAGTKDNPQSRRESLERAEQAQEAAKEALARNEEQLDESIEQSMARNFINRFRGLAGEEKAIATLMQSLLPQTIGLTTEQLPDVLRTQVQSQVDRQKGVRQEAGYLHGDLLGYYRRTRSELHKEIATDMEAEQFDIRLDALQQLIRKNVVGKTATECLAWEELFNFWADTLEEDLQAQQGAGGEGGGGGNEKGVDMELLIALIRARETEENLREHTRALDESYAENNNYHREATGLSDEHYALAQTLQPLENRIEDAEVKKLVSIASGEIMNAGVFLRRPQTDQETVDIQTYVIEMLASALQQGMQSGGSSSPGSVQQMQALMEALGEGGGAGGGGGNTQGGVGSDSGETTRGAVRNRAGDGDGGKAGAAELQRWPLEYQDLIQPYYEALEP